ncbi:sugar-binding domain-containing protein [Verrucomicrobiota bacterium]
MKLLNVIVAAVCLILFSVSGVQAKESIPLRRVLNLNGQWQICQGDDTTVPAKNNFKRKVPVPGLVDLAVPAFKEVGTTNSPSLRQSFWYRRTFSVDGDISEVARLKFHKVKYGCSVYLNGKHIGDGNRNFTPLYFDVKKALKGNGAENELVVRVGAHFKHELVKEMPNGYDVEKEIYIPGIFDSVELILHGRLYIKNVQICPKGDLEGLMVETTLFYPREFGSHNYFRINYVLREAKSGKIANKGVFSTGNFRHHRNKILAGHECRSYSWLRIPRPHLWSPEDPFLYELELTCSTVGKKPGKMTKAESKKESAYVYANTDTTVTRFGLRSFSVDVKTGLPVLNGKKYPLRGTNICMYRFFEDKNRKGLPWDKEWARKVIRSFKSMNWNSCRVCIGLLPEVWYEVADEEGFLFQDEYPIWLRASWPDYLTADKLVTCFRAWMHERWNHPSVVVWDCQNETYSHGILYDAVARVRGEDRSNRPWDFGWEYRMDMSDFSEKHAYPFMFPGGKRMSEIAENQRTLNRRSPRGFQNVSINEYGWLWLNRDGTPTKLSQKHYDAWFGPGGTEEQRRDRYGRYLAMITESYRSCRNLTALMHFCGLGYSDPEEGETSDNFINLEEAEFGPYFIKYVRDAFSPVGLMIDLWEPTYKPGENIDVPIAVISDIDEQKWAGKVKVSLLKGDKVLDTRNLDAVVDGVARSDIKTTFKAPSAAGEYEVIAELMYQNRPVRSYRLLTVE